MLRELLKKLNDLTDADRRRFVEFDPDDLKATTAAAALFDWKGEDHWIPFSQLRNEDGQLYASTWILEQKGIEI
jgi:hypothetical protein